MKDLVSEFGGVQGEILSRIAGAVREVFRMDGAPDGVVKKFLDDQRDLFAKKNADYGNNQIVEFGDFGVFVRAHDKFERLRNLYKTGKAPMVKETVEDTWIDLSVYAIIAVMYIRGAF